MQQGMFNNSESTSRKVPYDELDLACSDVLEEITDDVILGLCFEVHRAVKLNFFFLDEAKEDEKTYEIVEGVGDDVFGQNPSEKQFECVCPKCGKFLAAQRFAPHLEKCMKNGRQSFRKANERIANVGELENEIDEYDNDSDWNCNKDKKGTRRKREKSSLKNTKKSRKNTKIPPKNGDPVPVTTTDGSSTLSNSEVMTLEDRKALLLQACGVVSERTKKMCTRSHKCSQHTNEQRRYVRLSILGLDLISDHQPDEVPIDVDTVDEGFWDQSISRNPSPADASSTSNALKKKDKRKLPFKL